MIRRSKRRPLPETPPGAIAGTVRVDRRTKHLIPRLLPGEIAVIDHEDIDRLSAEGLIQRRARAVINASKSSSGRYPNLGPLLLRSAGITLIDAAGPEVMTLSDGAKIRIDNGRVWRVNGTRTSEIARGKELSLEEVEKALDQSKQAIAVELERFAENTIGYIKEERDLLLEAAHLPDVKTDFHGHHVLVVVRGYDYKADLAALRSYIRELKPVLVGVDGGADALVDFGLRPDLIIGDMDSVTTEALLSGAELIVHAYPGGQAPGLERLEALGIEPVLFEAKGTSEDIALLLAYERGAELIVAVGTHANLIEFMDKGRKGMASTFLTRLRVGPILVDAKGVSRLYQTHIKRRDILMLVGAALVTMTIVLSLSDLMRAEILAYWIQFRDWLFSVKQAILN